jgi:hypothetical protein
VASKGVLYGIIGVLGVAVVGGGYYIAQQDAPAAVAVTATESAPTPAPAFPPSTPSQAEALFAQQLVSDARQAIARGDFSTARVTLDRAERLAPQSDAVIAARRDLRDAQKRGKPPGPS